MPPSLPKSTKSQRQSPANVVVQTLRLRRYQCVSFDNESFAPFYCSIAGMHVSASSCRHGDTASNDFWLSLQMTHPSFVTRIVLVVCVWQILSARNWNNLVLLSSSLRKLLQFVGFLDVPVTLLHMPCPPLILTSPFRVYFLYTSKTTSTLLYVVPYNLILGRLSFLA